jgi:hypothetical protein
MPRPPVTPATWKRRAQLALGFACILILFILETVNAHRVTPSPASPYVWAALGLGAAGCLAWAVYCHGRARQRP